MSRKRKKSSRASSPRVILIFIVIMVGVAILLIKYNNTKDKAGNTENGDVICSQSIINSSYDKQRNIKTIEIKTNVDELNSIIITDEVVKKMKNNNSEYNQNLKDVIQSNKLSNRDLYNIKKAIELKYVNEDTKLFDYYWKITGFSDFNKFIQFCEDAFNNIETDR